MDGNRIPPTVASGAAWNDRRTGKDTAIGARAHQTSVLMTRWPHLVNTFLPSPSQRWLTPSVASSDLLCKAVGFRPNPLFGPGKSHVSDVSRVKKIASYALVLTQGLESNILLLACF